MHYFKLGLSPKPRKTDLRVRISKPSDLKCIIWLIIVSWNFRDCHNSVEFININFYPAQAVPQYWKCNRELKLHKDRLRMTHSITVYRIDRTSKRISYYGKHDPFNLTLALLYLERQTHIKPNCSICYLDIFLRSF